MRGANVRANAQGAFVQDYAAKRAAQMERARQIREERRSGGASTPTATPYERDGPEPTGKPSSGSPARYAHAQNNNNRRQQDGGEQYDDDEQYARTTGDYQGSPASQSLDNTARSTANRQPQYLAPRQQQQPLSADVGVARNSYVSREPVSTGRPATGTSQVKEVMVTEADFKVAVNRGILTPDQARQLWGILTDPSAQDRLSSVRPSANRAQQAPKQAFEEYDQDRYAPQMETANYGVHNAPPAPSRRYAHEEEEDNHQYSGSSSQRRGGGGYPQDPPSRRPSGRQQQREYDDEEEDYDRDYNSNARAPAKKAQPKGRALPEWNTDFVESSIPVEAPPVRGVAGGARRAVGSSKQQTRAPSPPPMDFGGGGYDEDNYDSYNRQPQQQQQQRQPAQRQQAPSANRRAPPQQGGRNPPPRNDYDDNGGGGDVENEDLDAIKAQKVAEFERALGEADPQEPQVPCGICGRTFRKSLIPRHEVNCAKASTKKRKTFDMTKARIGEIDGAGDVIRQIKRSGGVAGLPDGKKQLPPGKMPKWKLQHEQFQAILKNVSGTTGAVTGPPVMTHPDLDDRVPCPHCGRKFGEEAAERHIPKCATIRCNKPKGSIPNRPPRR